VGECNAFILQPHQSIPLIIKLPDITEDELMSMSLVAFAPQRRGCTSWDGHHDRLGMQVSAFNTSPSPVLAKLWTTVVKPVIDSLKLQVCLGNTSLRVMLV
jgi:hypothetical protein